MDKIAVGVLSFKRPDYLKRSLKSLEKNVWLDRADIFVFQDGAINKHSGIQYAHDWEVNSSIAAFRASKIPNKSIIIQKHNIGPAAGVTTMLFEMFGSGYDYVVLMADDMEVNKYFIKTHMIVRDQFMDDRLAGILRTGPVEAPFRGGPMYTLEEAESQQNKLVRGMYMMQDYGIWRHCWERIKDDFKFFHDIVTGCDWRQVVDYTWTGGTKINDPRLRAIQERFGTFPEDVIHVKAAERAGYKGLHTIVPRITGFGERSTLRDGYEKEWPAFRMEEITLWDVGDVEKYEIVNYSQLPKQLIVPSFSSSPSVSLAHPIMTPTETAMVYIDRRAAPFSIRGKETKRVYWRVRPNRIIWVMHKDVDFFRKNGFRLATAADIEGMK